MHTAGERERADDNPSGSLNYLPCETTIDADARHFRWRTPNFCNVFCSSTQFIFSPYCIGRRFARFGYLLLVVASVCVAKGKISALFSPSKAARPFAVFLLLLLLSHSKCMHCCRCVLRSNSKVIYTTCSTSSSIPISSLTFDRLKAHGKTPTKHHCHFVARPFFFPLGDFSAKTLIHAVMREKCLILISTHRKSSGIRLSSGQVILLSYLLLKFFFHRNFYSNHVTQFFTQCFNAPYPMSLSTSTAQNAQNTDFVCTIELTRWRPPRSM